MSDEIVTRSGDELVSSQNQEGRKRWATAVAIAALLVAGAIWFTFFRSSSASQGATIADCTSALTNQSSPPSPNLTPAAIGEGSTAGLAVFRVGSVWESCFTGMGTGTAPIPTGQMRASLSEPVAIEDGNNPADVLVVVHHNRVTASVIIDTAWTHSVVLSRGSDFEVLQLPTPHWPRWRVPRPRGPVQLGTILGFNAAGEVTFSTPFTWCPGSINAYEGQGC
jgi:hypothetical protein